ncbi:hypothetical protein PPERSA_11021 [Pseudocohnilembus persalinus]|uniref:Uncharacterized protein n=1 Tax=Pseudocohnilembus persalinus TaxID=266149 RepID=A0A0V0QZL2_PSEPJ|nr:hypothetical protein PPERSA_11021 [Pseudocohnilembus persalinus]|eukprot:KRX07472.1 hypothetical protein PPERSA_11021 [Pseudocohnilembus persalinus]
MEQQISNSQNNLQEPMTCLKNEHYNQQFQFFKFTENLEEMLQCFSCINEDPQLNKKISIDQILNFPASKIQNFPPLKDQSKDKQVRQIMEDFTQDKIKQFKEYIKKQIEQHYEQKIRILNQSKKDVIIQFEQIMQFTDVSQYNNIDQLKAAITQYKNKQINLEELFQEQLKMKKDFECQKKCKVMLCNQQKQQEITNQLNNLKQNLDQKFKAFTDEKITINTQKLQNLQRIIDQTLQSHPNQQENQTQQQINFHQSDYINNKKDEINIKQISNNNNNNNNNINDNQINNNKHNNNKHIQIQIADLTINTYKAVYSSLLSKEKTHHFKIKANFHQQKNYGLSFNLISLQDKDKSWINQNCIVQNDGIGKCFAHNGERQIIQGQKFVDFWKDGETVLNVVFNVKEKLFEIYDYQRKGYVKNFIDSTKIQGNQVILGIDFLQNSSHEIDLQIEYF